MLLSRNASGHFTVHIQKIIIASYTSIPSFKWATNYSANISLSGGVVTHISLSFSFSPQRTGRLSLHQSAVITFAQVLLGIFLMFFWQTPAQMFVYLLLEADHWQHPHTSNIFASDNKYTVHCLYCLVSVWCEHGNYTGQFAHHYGAIIFYCCTPNANSQEK